MFKGNYDAEKETLRISLTTRGATVLCIIMWIMLGGSGIICISDGSLGYGLFGALCIAGAIAYSIWAHIALKEYYEITREGVRVYIGTKERKHLRWDECTFVFVCRKYRKDYMKNLICSTCTVPWVNQRLPIDFDWPDETIEVPWFSLTEEQQAIVLEFCGGMRGGPQ